MCVCVSTLCAYECVFLIRRALIRGISCFRVRFFVVPSLSDRLFIFSLDFVTFFARFFRVLFEKIFLIWFHSFRFVYVYVMMVPVLHLLCHPVEEFICDLSSSEIIIWIEIPSLLYFYSKYLKLYVGLTILVPSKCHKD